MRKHGPDKYPRRLSAKRNLIEMERQYGVTPEQTGIDMKKIAFIFDRVMHYHRDLFRHLDMVLPEYGYELVLFSGKQDCNKEGRASLNEKIVQHQIEFDLTEIPVSGFMLRYQHRVARLIYSLRPSVVVTMCHSGTLSEWQLLKLKTHVPFKLVAWQSGYEYHPGRFKSWVLDKFIAGFDHHLAYHSNAKHFALDHGAKPDQVTIIHNTINETSFEYIPKEEARRLIELRHPQLAGKKIILYVGAVLEEKKLETVFEAMDLLARSDLTFLLVGNGPYLEEINRKHARRKDFVSTGRIIEGVGLYFDAADVFVLPGTGGLAINEAMAHGLAVISGYADGSADDLVIDGKNGFRLKSGSAEEIACRLGDMLSDPASMKTMGDSGRKMICGHFSFEKFLHRVVNALITEADTP
jgi:glycosyltransferase involved in cell wall biosynthesis